MLRANFKIPHHATSKSNGFLVSLVSYLRYLKVPFGSPDLPKASRHVIAWQLRRHFCSEFFAPENQALETWYALIFWCSLIFSYILDLLGRAPDQIDLGCIGVILKLFAVRCSHKLSWNWMTTKRWVSKDAAVLRMASFHGPNRQIDYCPPRKSNYTVWNEMQ